MDAGAAPRAADVPRAVGWDHVHGHVTPTMPVHVTEISHHADAAAGPCTWDLGAIASWASGLGPWDGSPVTARARRRPRYLRPRARVVEGRVLHGDGGAPVGMGPAKHRGGGAGSGAAGRVRVWQLCVCVALYVRVCVRVRGCECVALYATVSMCVCHAHVQAHANLFMSCPCPAMC